MSEARRSCSGSSMIAHLRPAWLSAADSTACCCGFCGGKDEDRFSYSAGPLIYGRHTTICHYAVNEAQRMLPRPELAVARMAFSPLVATRASRRWLLAWYYDSLIQCSLKTGRVPGEKSAQYCIVYGCGPNQRIAILTSFDSPPNGFGVQPKTGRSVLSRLARLNRCCFCGSRPGDLGGLAVGITTTKICAACVWTVRLVTN
jgi:hypothetical protein